MLSSTLEASIARRSWRKVLWAASTIARAASPSGQSMPMTTTPFSAWT